MAKVLKELSEQEAIARRLPSIKARVPCRREEFAEAAADSRWIEDMHEQGLGLIREEAAFYQATDKAMRQFDVAKDKQALLQSLKEIDKTFGSDLCGAAKRAEQENGAEA